MMYLTLAWRNIWRNKRRTLITLSSIGFAVFFACIMQSMQLGSYERMIDNTVRFSTGHLQIHANGYWDEKTINKSMQWDDELVGIASNPEAVELIAPRLESFALGAGEEQTKGVMIVGVDHERENSITNLENKIVEGQYLDESSEGVLLGKDLAKFLNIGVGDTLVLISQGYHGINAAGKFPIRGILKFPSVEFNQQAVFMRLPDAQYFYGADGLITSLSILLEESDDLKPVKEQLVQRLDTAKYEVMAWQEMMPELEQSIELDYYGGLIMIYILYAVIAFGIFGTFMMMTKERTYEFGILISIGMRKLKIKWMVAIEIFMLTFLGVISGALLSLPILIYMYLNPIRITGEMAKVYENFGMEPILPFSLDPGIFINQGIIILVISVFLGIYPMVSIQTLKVVKALKE